MSPYGGSIPRPVSTKSLGEILPRHAILKSANVSNGSNGSNDSNDSTTLFHITTAHPIPVDKTTFTLSGSQHPALVEAMRTIFNDEVIRGDTYPHETPLDLAGFEAYFFGGDAFILLRGNYNSAEDVTTKTTAAEWSHDLLGFFYIKPNFPGRCSHICNGGFMVNPVHRGLGIGGILGKAFLRIVPILGYRASMFNLVFVSNVASIKLWRRLGFQETGRVPRAGRLRGQGSTPGQEPNEGYVDAIQFYWDFETMPVPEEP
ncbi:hypothetical protein BGZ94_007669 [Podila epigama]|nr:hypothetical protein BGZ94_007669 [Podila epigama]